MKTPARKVAAVVMPIFAAVGPAASAGCGESPPGHTASGQTDPGDDGSGAGGAEIPSKIRYVLVIVKENHTFDNYFTGFPGARSMMTATLSDGSTIMRPLAPDAPLTQDICHTNECAQMAYRGGAMNGFDLLHAGHLPFVRYTEQQIPNYWWYARNFVLADHLFSATLGPSTPGHSVFWTGQSLSLDNAACEAPDGRGCTGFGCTADHATKVTAFDPDTCATRRAQPCFDVPSLTDHLPSGFTWMDYGGSFALMVKSVVDEPAYETHFRRQSDLIGDLKAGRLANLTIAHLWTGEESEHPRAYPCVGENFTVDIINAAMSLPQWSEMAIVLTWDDWGGFYDHVAPEVKPCANGEAFGRGFRLPAIIISPYAKKGFVLKAPVEQASVPRLVEELWGMSFMSTRDPRARDGVAGSLMAAFDFTQPPRPPALRPTHACP